MELTPPFHFHFFDPVAECHVVDRRLPHWSQAGTVCFITWRTGDSMPKTVLDRWHDDRSRWLRERGLDPADPMRNRKLQALDPKGAREFIKVFWNRWHDELDVGHGESVLRQPHLARIVADSLRHFDDRRYLLLDFVVMPNHVHALVVFPDEASLLSQCESWKHYTATLINRLLNRRGRFWQQDGFDHLVRSEEQFVFLRDYLAQNPTKAGLKVGEFLHYSKGL